MLFKEPPCGSAPRPYELYGTFSAEKRSFCDQYRTQASISEASWMHLCAG